MQVTRAVRYAAGIAIALGAIAPFTNVANGEIPSNSPSYVLDTQVRNQIVDMLLQEKSALRDVVLPDDARKQKLAAQLNSRAIPSQLRVATASSRQAPTLQHKPRSGGFFGLFSARPVVRLDEAYLDKLPAATGGKEFACLTEALYFEARGESVLGQMAVAEVIINRKASPRYPDTICAVIRQGASKRNGCQFSYFCDGRKEVITEQKAYSRVAKIARMMLDGREQSVTGGATHYHATSVRPKWSRQMTRTAAIGYHVFYRLPTKVSSR